MEAGETHGKGKTIAIFGGSFNPPHVAHVMAALWALSVHAVDQVMVIPTFKHPFAKDLAPYDARFEMCKLAFRQLGKWVSISRIEEELGGVSYTIDTVHELQRQNPAARFRLLVGGDIRGEITQWKRYEELQAAAPLMMVGRGGFSAPGELNSGGAEEFSLPAISSTEIRAAIRLGRYPAAVLPANVSEFIEKHQLYR